MKAILTCDSEFDVARNVYEDVELQITFERSKSQPHSLSFITPKPLKLLRQANALLSQFAEFCCKPFDLPHVRVIRIS